ncbi:hypothetical protein BD414DRAFT_492913 [Trametes punicea]|nr:hypothetical protein BD414DRAFT_492913 [Trametes punicea]
MEDVRQNAAREQENANNQLQDAAKRIEELESQLRQKDIEISNLRGAAVLNTNQPTLASATSAAAQSPTSSGPSISISQTRKRASEEEEENVICSATTSRATSALDLTAHASPMPADRMKELAALPEVAVDLDPTQVTPAIFTRQSLSSILGGSVQGLVVRCTESATQLARNRDIHDYLCPNMDHNAWSPAGPGKHGYMQVGLGRDRKLFNEGDYRHVFVGAGKHLVYCGWYHVFRVEPLTKEEWATLPPRVQLTYSETTLNKEKTREFRSVHQVLALYNSGELRAPCVRLQCVAFDTAFYQELVRANDQFFENKPRPVPPPVGAAGRSSAKRRRVAKVDEMAEDIEEGLGLAHAPASTKSVTQGSAPASSSIALPSSGSSATDTLTDGTAEASAAPRAPTLQDPSSSTIVPSPGGQTRRPTSAASNSIAIPSPGKQTRSSMRIQAAQSRSLMLRMRRKRGWDNTLQLTDSDEPASLWSSASEDDELYADE